MRMFKLPSGFEMPALGFGTYQLAGKACVDAVLEAIRLGCRHLDSAEIYKNSKEVSKAISLSGVPRKHIFITSKIAPSSQGYEPAKKACAQLLKGLDTDYLDLLLIHWPGVTKIQSDQPDNQKIRHETWRALIELKKQGVVRDIGVSNFQVRHLETLMKEFKQLPAVNQFELHPLLYPRDEVQFCRKHGIVIETYSPLARGDKLLLHNEEMKAIAEKHGKSVAQIAIGWALNQQFVVIPKSKHMDRIKLNLQVLDIHLSEGEMEQIGKLSGKGLRTCWDPSKITY